MIGTVVVGRTLRLGNLLKKQVHVPRSGQSKPFVKKMGVTHRLIDPLSY